jgi:hypothetical protein
MCCTRSHAGYAAAWQAEFATEYNRLFQRMRLLNPRSGGGWLSGKTERRVRDRYQREGQQSLTSRHEPEPLNVEGAVYAELGPERCVSAPV